MQGVTIIRIHTLATCSLLFLVFRVMGALPALVEAKSHVDHSQVNYPSSLTSNMDRVISTLEQATSSLKFQRSEMVGHQNTAKAHKTSMAIYIEQSIKLCSNIIRAFKSDQLVPLECLPSYPQIAGHVVDLDGQMRLFAEHVNKLVEVRRSSNG